MGESLITEQFSEVGKAIVGFQYAERVKSELIIAAKMVDSLSQLTGDELKGASKLYSFFLTALEGETNIALNVVGRSEFETAAGKIREAAEKTGLGQFDEAMKLLSEAISYVASTGQWAMQTLRDNHLL
jgi:hypothetical protein